jgi:hypothetical protein
MNKTYVTLAPTNIAALLIDGLTIHKYVSLCNGKGNLNKHAELD